MKIKLLGQEKKASYAIMGLGLMIISSGILGWLVYQQWDILVTYEWVFDWRAIFTSFVLFSLDLFLVALVWAWLMNTMGGQIDLKKHLRYYYLSHLARRVPGTVWYIVGRAYFYKQEGVATKLVSVASGIELIVATMAGIILGLLFTLSALSQGQFNLFILVIILLLGAILVHPRVVGWALQRLGSGEGMQMFRYINILQWLIAYLIVWAIGGATLYAIGNAITPIDLQHLPYMIGSWGSVGSLAGLLFFVPSKIGITEVSLSLLLATIMPAPVAILLTILTRILLFIYEMIWAAVLYFWA